MSLPTPHGDKLHALLEAVRLLNEYRLFLDIDVIFDSDDEKPGLRCFPASVFPEKAKGIYDHTTPLSGGVHLE